MEYKLDDLSEAKAEMLLNILYPEMEEEWIVRDNGAFYRNYSPDIMSLDLAHNRVTLSRDGLLKLLPDQLYSAQTELLQSSDVKQTFEDIQRREHFLQEAFTVFDSLIFRRRMRIESTLSETLSQKLRFILKRYFQVDISLEPNVYIVRLALTLPFASRIRGSYKRIKDLLEMVFEREIRLTTTRYSHLDSTRCWIPWLKYDIIVNGLNATQYQELDKQIRPVEDFLREWFVPLDTKCSLSIKQTPEYEDNPSLLLDYNTNL